jgi:magnesium transporter
MTNQTVASRQVNESGHLSFETAAQHATLDVPVVVCEASRFLGVVTIEDVLSAPADSSVEAVMDSAAPTVGPGTDQEVAAWEAVRHQESALCEVAADGRFLGLIPPHKLVTVLLSEHDEDLSRVGGFLKNMSAVRMTSEEPAQRRCRHRIPWLLLGLGGL